MTSSKSDLEAKEGQIPNESNFLEFVSLLGSLSTRVAGSIAQEDEEAECKQQVGAESQQEGLFRYFCLLYLHDLYAQTRCGFAVYSYMSGITVILLALDAWALC